MMRISLAAAILAIALLPACQTSRDVAPNKEISQSGALKVHPGLIKDQPAKPAPPPETAPAN
jgi:peptidoglycan-associated lipoprotein